LINRAAYPQKTGTHKKYSMTLFLNNSELMTFDPFITSANQH